MASYDEETLQLIWEKGVEIPDSDPDHWRLDALRQLRYVATEYGNRESE